MRNAEEIRGLVRGLAALGADMSLGVPSRVMGKHLQIGRGGVGWGGVEWSGSIDGCLCTCRLSIFGELLFLMCRALRETFSAFNIYFWGGGTENRFGVPGARTAWICHRYCS